MGDGGTCMLAGVVLFAGPLDATNCGCERKDRKDLDDIMDLGVARCIHGMDVRCDRHASQ
jgi:hypothetical protein